MKDVRVSKAELIATLKKNQEGHQAIFDEAVEGYRKRVTEILEDHLRRVKSGSLEQVSIHLPAPSNHTRDYERSIKMLELSLDDEIVMTEMDFMAFVMDDWTWKRQFAETNSAYSATAARLTESL